MTPPLFPRRDDADLARRTVAHLTRRPLQRAELKARLGLPPRARRISRVIARLEEAGILAWTPGGFRVLRPVRAGELDVPRPEFDVVDELEIEAGLVVRAVVRRETGEPRVTVARVTKFPSGGVRRQHVLGLSVDVALRLGQALLDMTDQVVDERSL